MLRRRVTARELRRTPGRNAPPGRKERGRRVGARPVRNRRSTEPRPEPNRRNAIVLLLVGVITSPTSHADVGSVLGVCPALTFRAFAELHRSTSSAPSSSTTMNTSTAWNRARSCGIGLHRHHFQRRSRDGRWHELANLSTTATPEATDPMLVCRPPSIPEVVSRPAWAVDVVRFVGVAAEQAHGGQSFGWYSS
jgi:hypothetical protein